MPKKVLSILWVFQYQMAWKDRKKTNKDFVAIITTKLLFKGKIRLQKRSWTSPNAQNSLLEIVLLSQK